MKRSRPLSPDEDTIPYPPAKRARLVDSALRNAIAVSRMVAAHGRGRRGRRRGARSKRAKRSRKSKGRKARRTRRQSAVAAPTRKIPTHVTFRHTTTQNFGDSITCYNVDTAGMYGFKRVMQINDFNQPWSDWTTTGVQPYGHDQLAAKYQTVRVKAVKIYIKIYIGGIDDFGGTLYWKMSDQPTADTWTSAGYAYQGVFDQSGGITAGTAADYGEAFRHWVINDPRFRTKELRPTTAESRHESAMIKCTWTPSKTHLAYDKTDFTQVLAEVGSSTPPAKLGYLHIGYIQRHPSTPLSLPLVTVRKSYVCEFGNPKPISNS